MENVSESTEIEGEVAMKVIESETQTVSQLNSVELTIDNEYVRHKYSWNETLHSHCLICDVAVCDITESSHNVFGQLKSSDSSRGSVFEKVGQILTKNLHSINLHSEVVCNRCFNLLVEYEETKFKLQTIRLDLLTKFESTANKHQTVRKVAEKDTQIDEGNVKDNGSQSLVCNETPLLVITEEGKVVDRDGKEKETPTNRKLLKGKSKASLVNGVKPKPYVCSVCGKGFRAFSHRVEHMLIHLGEKPWSCGECNKTFRTKSALRVHHAKHSGERPYACQQCGKSFLDKYYFEEHCRIHSGERPFVCTYCQRPFARRKDLTIHTKSHTGDKPYKCTSCPKTFAVKSRLDRHARIHSGEKPHHCEYCVKSFARRDDYKVHIRLHTGERPFRCSVCSRTFTNQSNCLVHVRMHEGSKHRYPCPMCSETFDRRNKVNTHIALRHSDVSKKQASEFKPQETSDTTEVDTVENHVQTLTSVSLQPLTQIQVEAVDTNNMQSTVPQQLLHGETLQSLTVADLHSLQTLPITQVAQLEWNDGTTGSTTTTYVNITPGTYVNIIN